MSPLKRTARASAKRAAGRGRHARPAEPRTTAADVPAELRPADYGFPTVHLPQGHAHVTSTELMAALDNEPGDDEAPTQQLPPVALAGVVVDEQPQPAHAEGLAPVPSVPFLAAGRPFQLDDRVRVRVAEDSDRAELDGRTGVVWFVVSQASIDVRFDGTTCKHRFRAADLVLIAAAEAAPAEQPAARHAATAVPAPLTGWERDLLHRPVREVLGDPDAPTQAMPRIIDADPFSAQERTAALELAILGRPLAAPSPAARHRRAPGVQHEFDGAFWRGLHQHVDRVHAVAETLAAGNDKRATELTQRLARLERAHMDACTQTAAPPLPRRIRGAALAAIEAGRGELAVQA